MKEIPSEIMAAVNALLAPYGVRYDGPEANEGTTGYVTLNGAAAYTGLSKATLLRAVRAGRLLRYKINPARQGSAVFAKSELDKFIRGV